MEFWNIVMLIILGYFCVYGIVNRICKTFETIAMAKAYVKYVDGDGKLTFEDIAKSTRK